MIFRFSSVSVRNRHERIRCNLRLSDVSRSRTSSRSSLNSSRASSESLVSVLSAEDEITAGSLSSKYRVYIYEDTEMEKLLTEDMISLYTQFKIAYKQNIIVKHVYPILFNMKGGLASHSIMKKLGPSGRSFDGVARLKHILLDAKKKDVSVIKIPKSASLQLLNGETLAIDGHLRPPEVEHGRRCLTVTECDEYYEISLFSAHTDLEEVVSRFSDLSSEEFSQRSTISEGFDSQTNMNQSGDDAQVLEADMTNMDNFQQSQKTCDVFGSIESIAFNYESEIEDCVMEDVVPGGTVGYVNDQSGIACHVDNGVVLHRRGAAGGDGCDEGTGGDRGGGGGSWTL